MTAPTPTTCEAEVELDLGLYAICTLLSDHAGPHRAELRATGGIATTVTWGAETCARCGHPAQRDPDDGVLYIAEPRRLCDPNPEPYARPIDTTGERP